MFIDSHCHLNLLDYNKMNSSEAEIIQKALDNKVERMLTVCTQLNQFEELLEIKSRNTNIDISVGVHPNDEDYGDPDELEREKEQLSIFAANDNVVAIGETGLDYYRTTDDHIAQQQRFINHIDVAKKHNKPLIIHSRQAKEDTVKILKQEQAEKAGGVLHCFTEDWEMAEQCLELDFYISFSGIVTFANAKQLQEVAKRVPLEKILIETDSPYLAPAPHRGKINQPAFVVHVAEFIAQLRGIDVAEVARHTTENYYNFIRRPQNKPVSL